MRKSLIPWRKERTPAAVARREEEQPFLDLHRRMNDLFDSFFEDFDRGIGRPWAGPGGHASWDLTPRVDVSETDTEVVVSADLPGLEEKDLQVTVDQELLTLRGTRQEEREDKKRNYHLMERSYGEFQRVIPLPAGVDQEHIKAAFKKGVLTVRLPKLPEAQSRKRTIAIESE
jgi:HSP20 family protein